jgi:hypothetical protein
MLASIFMPNFKIIGGKYMFKYFKEMRELKKMERQYKVIILGKVLEFLNGSSDILEMANKIKNVDSKDVVSEIVKFAKDKESKSEE